MTEKKKRGLLSILGLLLCLVGGYISRYSILGGIVLAIIGTYLYFKNI